MKLYPKLILNALSKVRYPGTGKSIVEMNMIADDIRIERNKVSFSILFDKPNNPFIKSIVKAAETSILTYIGKEVDIKGNINIKTKRLSQLITPIILPNVKNIIAIASGKGGVGKSTVATNLAVTLSLLGYKIGLLDADIYGPSIPKMFGEENVIPYMKTIDDKDFIIPIKKHGIKILSISFFIGKENAVIWRGTIASNVLKQMITDTYWGDLDYLLLDLPPGTSDIHLTLVQTIIITGVVIVTTPQEIALENVRKGINMFIEKKINVPVLGLIENMSYFTPTELPENKYYLFGKEGGKKLAKN